MTGVGQGIPSAFYTTVDGWTYEDALLLQENFDEATGPWVHSISYSSSETAVKGAALSLRAYYAQSNTEYQKLGALGISVFAASGDLGATNFDQDAGNPYSPAYGQASCSAFTQFSPQFPASSPYVTAVGATNFYGTSSEQVCSIKNGAIITSGGGFSVYFAQPSYQAAALKSWVASDGGKLTPTAKYNQNNRGYPDVSMLGHNYFVSAKDWRACDTCTSANGNCAVGSATMQSYSVDGTSAR